MGAQIPADVQAPAETAAAQESEEPLRQGSSSQVNRNRVQENQRLLAAQMLQYSLPMMGCFVVMLASLLIFSFVIYFQGWIVMSGHSDKPCDMPLKWWLLVMLFVPIIQCQITSSNTDPERRPKRFQAFVLPVVVMIGIWMVSNSKTCEKTAPELYSYVKLMLICQTIIWALSIVMSCGLVSLIFWMHRNGLLDGGPGPHAAARPGLIDDIETVAFDPSSFADKAGEDSQPSECSICTEEFVTGTEVKKTPCGHYFCEDCLKTWLADYAKTCPLCRADIEQALDGTGSGDDRAGEP